MKPARGPQALSAFLILLAPAPLWAASTYYVAPDGNDSANGTELDPFATVGRAQSAASPGDTVLIRGGLYAFSGSGTVGVAFNKSGTGDAPINYFAYPGEVPVFDLSDLAPSNRVTGLDVHCSYIHLRGLEVTGVHQYQSGQDSWGVRIQGSGNTLENLNVHHNDAPGVFITSGADNLVLNCDSHHNYDYLENGGSGDGFGCHSSGGNNVLSGCRAYDNSDDGFDFINAAGSCTVERSLSFRNGFVPDTTNPVGNGAGFKAGGYGSPPSVPGSGAATHTVRQCVAFGNRAQGFYANHHPGRIYFYNNTAFDNAANYNMLADSGYPSDHVLRNNIAMGRGGTIANLTGGNDDFNSWTLPVIVSTEDFSSLDAELALSARAADGSLRQSDLARLVPGSDLIDAGSEVGLAYNGAAPDLGAVETGSAEAGAGGASGNGGSAAGGFDTGAGGASDGGVAEGGSTTGGEIGLGGAGEASGGGGLSGVAGSGGMVSTGGMMSAGGVGSSGAGPSDTGGGDSTPAGGEAMNSGGSGAAAVGGSGDLGTGGSSAAGGTPIAVGGSTVGAGGATIGSGGDTTSSGASTGGLDQRGADDAGTESGCGCRLGADARSRRGPSPGGWLLGLGLIALVMRRRARQGSSAQGFGR